MYQWLETGCKLQPPFQTPTAPLLQQHSPSTVSVFSLDQSASELQHQVGQRSSEKQRDQTKDTFRHQAAPTFHSARIQNVTEEFIGGSRLFLLSGNQEPVSPPDCEICGSQYKLITELRGFMCVSCVTPHLS